MTLKGSVFPRGKKWVAQLDLGRDPATGQRRRYWQTWPTKQQAEADLARLLEADADARLEAASRRTLGDYLDAWYAYRRTTSIEPSTLHSQRTCLVRVQKIMGALPLAELGRRHIETLHRQLQAAGYTPATQNLTHVVLSTALNEAVRRKLIVSNPASGVPAPQIPKKRVEIWESDQVQSFFAACERAQDELFWRVMLASAVRIGELIALRWRSVRFADGMIAIEATRSQNERGGDYIKAGTKTAASRRPIMLPAAVIDRLRAHQDEQRRYAAAQPPGLYHDQGFVFTTARGDYFRYAGRLDLFHRTRARADLPHLTPHGLRHTAATIMLYNGVNYRIVADILGHKSVQTTLDLYAHATDQMQAAALSTLSDMLNL